MYLYEHSIRSCVQTLTLDPLLWTVMMIGDVYHAYVYLS